MKIPAIVALTAVFTAMLLIVGSFFLPCSDCEWKGEDGSYTLGKELQDLWDAKGQGALTEAEYTKIKSILLQEVLGEDED